MPIGYHGREDPKRKKDYDIETQDPTDTYFRSQYLPTTASDRIDTTENPDHTGTQTTTRSAEPDLGTLRLDTAMNTSTDPKILAYKDSDIIDTTAIPTGAKRQEDTTTQRLTDNTPAGPRAQK